MQARTITAVIAAAAALTAASPAAAAPARNTTLGPGPGTFTWEGVGSGILATQDAMDSVGCTAVIHDCDDTLIEVKGRGKLTISTGGSDPLAPDTDLQLFEADSSGAVKREIQESAAATPTPVEKVSAEVEPGFYVARIDYAIALNGTVQGEAKFEPAAAGPAATIAKVASSKVKSFKGTAGEGTASVEIGLLKTAGSGCQQLGSDGKFGAADACEEPASWIAAKGTSKWSFKLRKALAKGKYVLFARAIDGDGNIGEAAKRPFTVKK